MNTTRTSPQAPRRRRTLTGRLVGALLAGTLAAIALPGLSGCDKKEANAGATAAGTSGGSITVGFIYVGSMHDYGYNQAHAEGAAAVKSMSGVKVVEQENVPETIEVEKAMQGMIKQDEAKAVFPTSYGYFNPSVLKVAPQNPSVTFLHCGGQYKEGMPANVGTYFGYIDECEYLSGTVAGYTSKSKHLGFIAAKPIPQVLRNINAFTLGARAVDPSITTTVIFTGDWFLPVKEAEAANSLINQGVDVITMHVDSPKTIIETCGKAKTFVCGYHSNGSPLAPESYLTGAEWNWSKPYKQFVADIRAGKAVAHSTRGGLKDEFVKMSPYGPAVSSEAKAKTDALKAKFLSTEGFVIFKGPLKDNTGKELYKAGEEHVQTDPVLEGMNYLVEGVVGKAP
jgi:simple sugar transport system substrate-binding protein